LLLVRASWVASRAARSIFQLRRGWRRAENHNNMCNMQKATWRASWLLSACRAFTTLIFDTVLAVSSLSPPLPRARARVQGRRRRHFPAARDAIDAAVTTQPRSTHERATWT
jgi:hypothetical protein